MSDPTKQYNRPLLKLGDSNYDDFLPVKIFGLRGRILAYLPTSWVAAPDTQERDQLIARGLKLYNQVEGYIDPAKLINPEGVEGIASLVALTASSIIVINLMDITGDKWQENPEYSSFRVKFEEDLIPANVEEATSITSAALTDRALEKLKPELLAKALSNDNAASWFVWRHIFFCIFLAIECDHGPIESVRRKESGKQFDLLFEEYKEKEFEQAFLRATYFYGEILARNYLEAENPTLWSFERFADLFGFEPIKDTDFYASVSIKKERAAKIVNKILSASDSDPELSWADEDGKRIFQFTIEVTDQSQINLVDLVDHANKGRELRGGPFNTKIKADEDELKTYPVVYREAQKTLRTLGYVFERCIKKNKNWREVLLAEFPILKDHSHLLEIVPVIRAGQLESVDEQTIAIAVDKGFSSPSDIAAEIAARCVFSNYKPFDVTPRTLKEKYASGKFIRFQDNNETV